MAEKSRWEEIKEIWRNADYRVFYKVLGWTVVILVALLVGREIYAHVPTGGEQGEVWGYGINVFTSVLSTVFTVTVLDILNRKRIEDELKRQLVIDAASISNEFAKNAVHQLWRRKWLRTGDDLGLLKGRDLTSANLQGAVLMDANLIGADLRTANLQEANLIRANLQKAVLKNAKLQNARMIRAILYEANLEDSNVNRADLYGADLSSANLKFAFLQRTNMQHATLVGTDLSGAHLHGADLFHADLRGANFYGCSFDETTRLPNGRPWRERQDIIRFTDPTHPDFDEVNW